TVTATHGEHVSSLADELKNRPGIEMVTAFGTSLHVSGHDSAALEGAVAPYRGQPGLDWQRAAPSLEDVFIDLLAGARYNFQLSCALHAGAIVHRRGRVLAPCRRHAAQGIFAAAARSHHLCDHGYDSAAATGFVRLRHQHDTAPAANRRAGSGVE